MVQSLIRKIVLILTVFVCWTSVTECRAQNIISLILSRIENNGKAINVLRADVTMAAFDTKLKTSDMRSGSLTYLPRSATTDKRHFRVNWIKPMDEQFSLVGDDYEIYRPRLNVVHAGKIGSRENDQIVTLLKLLQMSKKDLVTNYSVMYIGQETLSDDMRVWHLQLLPKSVMKIKSTELWGSGDGMIQQIKVTQKNGDATTIRLKNIENTTLEDIVFKLKYSNSIKKT